MQKRDVPYLVLGLFLTAVTSCQTVVEPPEITASAPNRIIPSTPGSEDMVIPAPEDVTVTSDPLPATPSMIPAIDEWLSVGDEQTGLSLSIPPHWVNLTGRISIPTMGNRLGINLLFAADSERTGKSLLAGKPISDGAYVSGLIISPPAAGADPQDYLADMVTGVAPSAVRLTEILPIESANGVQGYGIDVSDGLIGLNIDQPTDIVTRIGLFTTDRAEGQGTVWVAVVVGASPAYWQQEMDALARITQSAMVTTVRPGAGAQEGRVVVQGEMNGDRDLVSVNLERRVTDVWTFTIPAGRYASLFLRPEAAQLDPTLVLFGPDQQTIIALDNGYAGVTESVTDLFLAQPGTYIVEVNDFYLNSGRYTLLLETSDQPQYSGGGDIVFGEVLQGQLPANGRHQWTFNGSAGQHITVVVEPGESTFDPVIELFAPDGRRLLELDEGFSGDPELIYGFELPEIGEYVLQVHSFSERGGTYTLSLDEGDREIVNYYDAGDLSYGAVRQQTLHSQEVHAWFFQGTAGDHVLVRVTPLGPSLDVDVWLLDGDLNRIASVDSYATGEPETIEMNLAMDGQFVILVRDYNREAGDYEIALGAAPAATPELAGSLSYGDTIMGAIQPETTAAWAFNARLGDIIEVSIRPNESKSDIQLLLQNPDGSTVLEVDAGSAGQGERIDGYTIAMDGQWRLLLREFFGEPATYELSLDRSR